jgi:glycosyltransferase involved in cell wall biosynthesis
LAKFLGEIVARYHIDILQAFDSTVVFEAYLSQFWHNVPVYGMITAQGLPTIRLPKQKEISLVNPDTRKRYIEILKWPPEKLNLIIERLDIEKYSPINVSKDDEIFSKLIPNQFRYVTLVSRISKEKWSTLQIFLDAAQYWENNYSIRQPAKFVFVGGGSEYSALQAMVIQRNLSDVVILLGERNDIPKIMNVSSIVVGMASTCQQGIACGRPVIVIGENGYIGRVDPETVSYYEAHHFNIHDILVANPEIQLCSEIASILADDSYASKLGEFGRKIACDRYNSEIGAKKLERIYLRLLNDNKPKISNSIFKFNLVYSCLSYYLNLVKKRTPLQ